MHVDDVKVAGPDAGRKECWRLITTDTKETTAIVLDPVEPSGRYLGGAHERRHFTKTWHGESFADQFEETPMDCNTAVTTEGKRRTDRPTDPFEGPGGGSAKMPAPPPKRRFKTTKDKEVRVTEIAYNMDDFFVSCVDLYCDMAKVSKSGLPIAANPFLEE